MAAGDRAPGVQVDSSAGLSGHSYLYATPGTLYLTPDHMKWDYLDQRSFALAAAFDPPDGELKVSKEMMASIVGLDLMTLILSDGIDFSKETFIASYGEAHSQSQALDPDNLNPKIYYGPLFRGMGAAFIFENGQLFGKETLRSVAGVEVYDFGSRYDTQPEFAGIRALLSNEEALVHSVHFNYAGELPADTTVIMAVGDSYETRRLDWKYSDVSFTSLTSVCSLDTDPFGWFSAEGQKTLQQKTALIGEKNVGDSVMKQLASTGDNKTDAVVALSLLVTMLSVALGAALIQQRRKKMLSTR